MVPDSVRIAAVVEIVKSQVGHSVGAHPDAVVVERVAAGQVNALAAVTCGADTFAVRVMFASSVGSGQPEISQAEQFPGDAMGIERRDARLALLSRMYGLKLAPVPS